MKPPPLAAVPSNDDLTLKLTTSGVTLLKQNRFRKRYTGNKYSAVDINGKLWLKSTELQAEVIRQGEEAAVRRAGGEFAVLLWKQKKASVETPAGKKSNKLKYEEQIYNNNAAQPAPTAVLIEKKPREYTVNKREVRQRLLGYINTMRGKKELYFWTVTFPQGTPDEVAYRMLNIWLTSLRQYGLLKEYLWIAERQPTNEFHTIHFHIAIPHRMPVQRANAMMRGTLKTFAKRGQVPYTVFQCNRYNGVDISKNRDTKRVTNFAIKKGSRALITYLTKYVTKNDAGFAHLAWHNSRGFSSLFTGLTFTVPEFVAHNFHHLINRAKAFATDFFTFIPWAAGPPEALQSHLYELNSYLQNLKN